MAEIDFIGRLHTGTKRDYVARVVAHDKAKCAEIAKQWGFDFWDGERHYGYGGYKYDGRWRVVAEAMARHYGLKAGDLRASNVKMTPSGSSYDAKIQNSKFKIQTNLPSGFNVYNSLAAVGVGRVVGLKKTQIEQGIAALESVEGRMTTVDEGQPFEVIVDYAHTPDSYEKLFRELRPVVKGKMIAMFGSAGRRDKTKRPVQGEIAGKYCDEVILTEEDDRDEDGNQILEDIAAGAEKAGKIRGKDLFLTPDRPKAIEFTLSRAKAGDTVLLLGKGHEKTIERDDREDVYDEIAITRQTLKKQSA